MQLIPYMEKKLNKKLDKCGYQIIFVIFIIFNVYKIKLI